MKSTKHLKRSETQRQNRWRRENYGEQLSSEASAFFPLLHRIQQLLFVELHSTGGVAWINHQVSSRPNVADFDTPFRNWRIEWLGKKFNMFFAHFNFPFFTLPHRVSTTHLTTNGSCCTQKIHIALEPWQVGKNSDDVRSTSSIWPQIHSHFSLSASIWWVFHLIII